MVDCRSSTLALPAAVALLAGLGEVPDCAADPPAPPQCFGVNDQAPSSLERGVVVGKGAAEFLAGLPPNCPPTGCLSPYRVSVRPGDAVAVSARSGDYICAEHWPARGRSPMIGGWLASDRVDLIPNSRRTRSATWWSGRWTTPTSSISIAVAEGRMKASGQAYWQGIASPHFGHFTASGRPDGDELDLEDGDCSLRLLPVGERIAVVDNGMCGGFNVSFSGFYARTRRRPR